MGKSSTFVPKRKRESEATKWDWGLIREGRVGLTCTYELQNFINRELCIQHLLEKRTEFKYIFKLI